MGMRFKRGEGDLDGIVILAVLLIIIWVTPKSHTPSETGIWTPGATISSYGTDNNTSRGTVSGTTLSSAGASRSAQSVSLGTGNASYSYQPYEEYVTIENYGRNPIDITGWQLKNGKDQRPYNLGGTLQRFSADIAVIPRATLFLSPTGQSALSNVVLGDGEKAIVTTGGVSVTSPYRIVSFKENICTGYIETHPDYAFTPSLTQNCPRPLDEPGVKNLPTECRDFMNTLSSCRIPEFGGKDSEGEYCENCVQGKLLPSSCVAFVREHFTYQGCVANHRNDPGFEGRTWRIFLGRGWEMWNKDYESIELFDNLGQLVDFKNY
ncbi:MAG: hypothetical protein Q7R67_00415 [bacterium]|nr:hypothetical protein [bacterium]